MTDETREYQKAIDYLCGLIDSGELKIGSRLPTERKIAETVSIGRNSIREAIRMLENTGAVESRRGSGNYLVGNTSKTISSTIRMMLLLQQTDRTEICSFRRNIEKAVCRTIMENKTFPNWKKPLSDLLFSPTAITSMELQADLDRQFHYLLIHATENRFWIAILEAISDVYRQWIDFALATADKKVKQQLHETHCEMIHALEENDLIRCEMAIDQHYDLVDLELEKH